MHFMNEIIIAAIVLALFGPKTLQMIARNVGKGVGQVKQTKEKVLADSSLEELVKMKEHLSHVPLTPQQASKQAFKLIVGTDAKRSESKHVSEAARELEPTSTPTSKLESV